MKLIRFTREARKHRIGKASAYHVMANTAAEVITSAKTGDTLISWMGDDERGRELHVVAVDKPDCFLVIHVSPRYS